MWNITEFTNSSHMNSSRSDDDFSYYSLFVVLFVLLPLAVVDIVVLVVIVREKTTPGFIRLILANNIVSSEIVIAGLVQIFFSNVILSVVKDKSPHFACRLALVTISSGGAGRFLFMSAFAVAVFCLVKSGTVQIKMRPTIIASVVLWMCSILPNTLAFSSKVIETIFINDIVCSFYGVPPLSYIYCFGCILFYGLCNIVVSVVFPILTFRYIKISTISDDVEIKHGLIKCAVFLCLGNILNFFGLFIPLLIATAPARLDDSINGALMRGVGILVILSLIPVPIFTIVYFKNIHKGIISFFCSVRVWLQSVVNHNSSQ